MSSKTLVMSGLAACLALVGAGAARAVVGKFPAMVLTRDGTGDFGPNTTGTTTAGWQEAVNWCVNNKRDLYVKGGAEGASVVYSVSSTINIPATKNFKIWGGNYTLNWTGASTSDMLVINSAKNCHYEFGVLSYGGTAAAMRFKPRTAVDGETSIRDSEFKTFAVVRSGAAGGNGVVLDTSLGLIWFNEFSFNVVSGFGSCVAIPAGGSFTQNTVKCIDLHSNATNGALLDVSMACEVNVFDVGIGVDGTPAGIKGVDVSGQGNSFKINTRGGFPAGNDLVFESTAAKSQVTLIGAVGTTDPGNIVTDLSAAANNQVRWVGPRVPIQSVSASAGVWSYTQRLFPAILRVEGGAVSSIKHIRGPDFEDYGTNRADMLLSVGDVLQVTSSSAPTIKVIPLVR